MNESSVLLGIALILASCSGSVDVDAAAVLPGTWECDDGIVITFKPNGKYEWRVPPEDGFIIHVEDNDHIRMNDDGGHSIFDSWRLKADSVEMDMFGEADRYSLSFKSETSFRMDGPDALSCRRQ
jgi:hypothetical protein